MSSKFKSQGSKFNGQGFKFKISGLLRLSLAMTMALFIMSASTTNAQSITDTLTWNVDKLTDLKTINSFDYSCTFKTQGNKDINWVQGGGSVVNTLQVSKTEGTWTDVSQVGSITYSITLGAKSGTIHFERNTDGLFVIVDFSPTNGLKHSYHVTTVQAN
jgi:hypothetical protein